MTDILPIPASEDSEPRLPSIPSSTTRDLAASFVEGVNSVDGTLLDMYKRHYYAENDPGKTVPVEELPSDLRQRYPNGLGQNVLDQINAQKAQEDGLNSAHANASASLLETAGRYTVGALGAFASPSGLATGGALGAIGGLGVKGLASLKAIRAGIDIGQTAAEQAIGKTGTKVAKNFMAGVGHGASFMGTVNALDQENQRQLGEDTTNESILNGAFWPSMLGGALHVGAGFIHGANAGHEGVLHAAVKDMLQNGDKLNVENYVKASWHAAGQQQVDEALKTGVDLRGAMKAQGDVLSRALEDADPTPYTPHPVKLSPIDNPNLVESLDHTLNDLEINPIEWDDKTLHETDAFKDTDHLYDTMESMLTDHLERTDDQKDIIKDASTNPNFEKDILAKYIAEKSDSMANLLEKLNNLSEDDVADSAVVNDLTNRIEQNKKSLNNLFRRQTILKAADINKKLDDLDKRISAKGVSDEDKETFSKQKERLINKRTKLQKQKYDMSLPDLDKVQYTEDKPHHAFKKYNDYQQLKQLAKNTEIANKILNGKAPNPNEMYMESLARLKGERNGDVGADHAVKMEQLVREAETDVQPKELEKQAQGLVDEGKISQEDFDATKEYVEKLDDEHKKAVKGIRAALQCMLGGEA